VRSGTALPHHAALAAWRTRIATSKYSLPSRAPRWRQKKKSGKERRRREGRGGAYGQGGYERQAKKRYRQQITAPFTYAHHARVANASLTYTGDNCSS